MNNPQISPDTAEPILIVGGGIGGLSMAIALAQKGYPSKVFEQASQFGEIGAGIQLGPNAFRTMERLGIADGVSETAVFVKKLIMMDSINGREAGSIALGDKIKQHFDYPYAVTHRADLHNVLLDQCMASPLINLVTSMSASGFEQDENGVTLHFDDAASETGSALIGADGLWSKIRGQLLEDGPPRVSGHIAYRAVLPLDEFPESMRWDAATLWAGPRTHLVHYPLRNWKLFNIVATFHSDFYVEGWNEPGERDVLLRQFKDVGPKPMSIILKPESWRRWVLCDRDPVDNWSKGRVTLLGDAAHPMLQYFAQGATMAMEDAVCLADQLVGHDGNMEATFKAYQEARAPRTAKVQLQARALGDLYHMSGVRRWIRNAIMRHRKSEKFYEGLAWLYGGP